MSQNNKNTLPNLKRRGTLQAMAGFAAIASPFVSLPTAFAQSKQTKMPTANGRYLTIDGNQVYIEERGSSSGIPIIMSAGGQNRIETLRPLAENLSKKYRVITWDRANLGYSDVVFRGARDLDLWSDQQADIIRQLDLGPTYFIGASAGSRTAYTTALRYPDHTRGLFTFLTTGGGTVSERLAARYYYSYADLAEAEGMSAVAETDFWATRIAMNPRNKDRLLSMNPNDFATTMRRWGGSMRSSDVMIGINADGCRQIKANGTPTGIIQGCPEATAHRRDRSELYAELTGATLIPTPDGYCEEETEGPAYDTLIERPEVPESGPFRAYEMITMLPEIIDTFIQNTEARYKELGYGSDAFSFNIAPLEEQTTEENY